MAALIARVQSRGDRSDRYAIFDALIRLEDRAIVGGAPALTLRKIAEVRFLVGILREAVRPAPVAPLRTVLRMRAPKAAQGSGSLAAPARICGSVPGQPHAAADSAA